METKNNKVYSSQTMNATEYMKEAIKKFLISKKYSIVFSDISCEVSKRFGKVGAVTTVKLTVKDEEENVYTIEDLNTGDESMSWLVEFIKKKEDEAIKAFIEEQKSSARDESNEEMKPIETQNYKVSGIKTKDDFVLSMCFSTSMEDMAAFLTRKEFVSYWAGPSAKFTDDSISFENIVLKDLVLKDKKLEMKYKWQDWDEFSSVAINFEEIGSNLKLSLKHRGVPVELVDIVKNHWINRIFGAISSVFKCAIKPI